MRPKVIAIIGPTASGKSALGAYLAKKLRGEIISADSRQVYRHMKVISRAEPGHMVGVADPRKQFSAGQYTAEAREIIEHLLQRGKLPIVVGGTGFYADTLLRGLSLPEVAPNTKLRAALGRKTTRQLLAQLKKLDPQSAARVDPHNKVRLIRAIEIAKAMGSVPPLTTASAYDVLWLGISPDEKGYEEKLRKGVLERLRRGMLREAKALRTLLPRRRFRALGFEFVLLDYYLDGQITRDTFVEHMVRGERKYAKRQMRWFKRNTDIHWVTTETEALKQAEAFLKG